MNSSFKDILRNTQMDFKDSERTSDYSRIKANDTLPLIGSLNKKLSAEDSDATRMEKKQLLNKLDNQILSNLKTKISNLTSENEDLSKDLATLQRNYDALSLKMKEDQKRLKRLEEESNARVERQKQESLERDIADGYRNKIEELNSIVKDLERKLKEKQSSSSKISESFCNKERNYQTQITRLEEKITIEKENTKKLEADFIETKKIMKNLDREKADLEAKLKENLVQSDSKLKELRVIEEALRKEISESRVLNQETDNRIKALLKEKDLSHENHRRSVSALEGKLKEESERKKELSDLIVLKDRSIEEFKSKIHTLGLEKEGLMNKLESIQGEYSSFRSNEIDYLEKNIVKMDSIVKEKDQQIEKLNREKSELVVLNDRLIKERSKSTKNPNSMKKDSFSFNFLKIQDRKISLKVVKQILNKQIGQHTNSINHANILTEKIANLENKCLSLSKALQSISITITTISKSSNSNKSIANVKTLEEENKSLRIQLDSSNQTLRQLEARLKENSSKYNKKKEKLDEIFGKYDSLLKENRSYEDEIKKFNADRELVNSVNQKIKQLQGLFDKVKLALETLYMAASCKSCLNFSSNQIIMECGHSLCEGCLGKSPVCPTCKVTSRGIKQNIDLNNLSMRISYINQMKEDIESLMRFASEG